MKIVVLGLSLSSSWGNGHATTYRALLAAMAERGHEILFLERERDWYAQNRDLATPDFCRLRYYRSVEELADWRREIADADAVIVGSYVPEGIAVGRFVQDVARSTTAFYDIDTPVTLAALERGACDYVSRALIAGYSCYLSFTGGPTLERIEREFGARAARALFCSVDAERYRPLDVPKRWDLTYLGTYSADRQTSLQRLLIDVAERCPDRRFAVAGSQYPATIEWPDNVDRIDHLPPAKHAAFYSASRFTLNLTRADMIDAGWSPSVRLFEAGACGTAIISDRWPGIGVLFEPNHEVVLVDETRDVLDALALDTAPRGSALRKRIVRDHSARRRAEQLEGVLRTLSANVDRPCAVAAVS